MGKLVKTKLNESLSNEEKSQIESEVIKVLKSSDLKTVISGIVSKELKGNKDLEDKMVDITKNSLIQLYKALWTKHNVWSSSLKNKS